MLGRAYKIVRGIQGNFVGIREKPRGIFRDILASFSEVRNIVGL